jgi:hypothetical protein
LQRTEIERERINKEQQDVKKSFCSICANTKESYGKKKLRGTFSGGQKNCIQTFFCFVLLTAVSSGVFVDD